MSEGVPAVEEESPGRLFVPSLALTTYAEQNLNLFSSFFLLDIALTFGVTVGAASQIATISAVASMLVGLVVSVLSVRFSHKLLLLAGAAIITVGVLGCSLAPSFMFMQIFYPLDGVGSVIATSMGYALVGKFLPLEKRSKAIGWIVAAASLTYVIGGPLGGFIAGVGSWRSVLLWYFLPVSVVGLILAYFSIPSTPREQQAAIGKEAYLSSLKQVLLNKSAAACLACTALYYVSFMWGIYAITFYRTRFSVPLEYASIILLGNTLAIALGSIAGGRLVNRFGRKRLLILSLGSASVLMAIFVYMPFLWIVWPLDMLSTFLRGMGGTAGYSLGLEQAPKARGTMMSLLSVFGSLGAALGIALSGPVLDNFGFLVLVPILGVFGVASVVLNYFTVTDPYKT